MCRHCSIFPGRLQPSIFDADELNFRVRNGNGWNLIAINTDYLFKGIQKIEQQAKELREGEQKEKPSTD